MIHKSIEELGPGWGLKNCENCRYENIPCSYDLPRMQFLCWDCTEQNYFDLIRQGKIVTPQRACECGKRGRFATCHSGTMKHFCYACIKKYDEEKNENPEFSKELAKFEGMYGLD